MNYLHLSMQEAKFLVALLECGSSNRQTALQLLAADHLFEPFLLPKLRKYVKTLKKEAEWSSASSINEIPQEEP